MLRKYFLTLILLCSGALEKAFAQATAPISSKPVSVEIRSYSDQLADSIKKAHSKSIRIIDASSLPASNKPLYVVDGKPISEQDFKSINPNDIDKIEVLKGVNAVAIYGSSGTNGVLVMTMKALNTKPLPQPVTKKGRLN